MSRSDHLDVRPRFSVYFDEKSYYSQRVLLAFFVKDEAFIEKRIDYRTNEHYERTYMLKNPDGALPLLEDGSHLIRDSSDIIDYLDAHVMHAPRLAPDPSTDLGQEVARFRKLLDVNVTIIRFGLTYNPHLAPPDFRGRTILELKEETDGKISLLEKLASEHPDLKDAYLAKIPPLIKTRREDCSNPDVVQRVMDELQATLDGVEEKIVETSKGESLSAEAWMFGSDFTAADIILTVLLRRLSGLGLSSLYLAATQRPALNNYWERLQNYPAYCRFVDFIAKYDAKRP